MSKPVILAMIPARYGSTRLKLKNLALINGKPMISYAIDAAKKSGVFENVVVNSEHEIFEKIAERYEVNFYQRPEQLGSSTTKSDDVVLDFMDQYPADIVAWVNPISPLQTGNEIKKVIEYFVAEGLDSLITVKDEPVHCTFDGNPINFSYTGKFAQTQDLTPVQPFVYSVMVWRVEAFRKAMKENGYAFFCGKVGTYTVSKLSAIIVKTEMDLKIVDNIQRSIEAKNMQADYDQLVKGAK
jgi:CMP-N-acetylneuraminic acid synthetase